VIKGGNGSDTIQGGTGMDTIYGGSNSSDGGGVPRRFLDIARTLLEDRGDTINGGPGNDTIFGEAGNDVIVGGGGNDTIDGGTGVNIVNGALQVPGTDRHDRLDVTTNVRGIKSFPGSLSLSPELSFETDVIVRSGFGAGALVTLFRVPLDQISAIHIDAGSGNDTITVSPTIALPTVLRGGPGNDAIHAGAGPSTIFGGDGDDRIYGGPANDTIDCGPGIDTVVLSGGTDVIDPTSCEHQIAGPQVGTTDPGENHPPILAAIGDKTVDEGSPLTFTAFATDQSDEARFVGRNGYQSAQDSPFNGLDFSYLHLENFEDGALNTPGVTVSAGEVYPAPPADLVSQWRANGTAADSAGGNDGILRGNTRFADGHSGEAFEFDGAGDYVEVPNSLSLRFREELTLEGWIFLSDERRPAFFQSIAAKGTRTSGSVWELSVVSDPFNDRPRLRSHARLADGSTISINGDTTLRFNEWYHVAMTYNGDRLACYLNGELEGSILLRSSELLALSTGPLLIGEDLSGLIDELSVYDRALSGAEIQAIVNAGGDDDSTDSVDSDDGEIDGRGTAGKSFVIDSGDPVAFTFNANTLHGFPTHVGAVWTDSMLGTQLTLEAFDANGASLGTTVGKLRDPSLFGRTAEDRFLGVTYTAGISKIELRSSGDGPIEIDHLQYGRLQGQPARFSLDPGAPDGATINPLTGVFSWTPSEEQGPNVYSVTIRASDGGSPALSDSETFTITVNEVNDPPQMPPIPDLFVVRGKLVQFRVIASDFDLTTIAGLSFQLAGGAPAGATIDPLTGEFRWTPSVTQPLGESFVTVLVTDQGDSPLTSGVSISITVQADIDPPTVTDVRIIADLQAITSIVIEVSEPLDPASARDPSHYHLVGLGADGRLGTADDHEVPLSAAAYVAGARAIVLTPQEHLPFNEMFQLLVQPAAGAGGSPLADVFGNTLDGDGDGLAGGNHEMKFARGKSLSFLDHDRDTVNLTLWGSGVMELLESGAGGALHLRALALKAGDAYLSGEVTPAAANSDGLALLNVSGLSGVENLLSDPPFVLTVNARGVPPIFTLPGDFNRNGTVDLADYVAWRKTLGASQLAFTGADGNGDGIVDAADHAVWNANFGQSIASPPPLPGDFNRDAAVDARDYVMWRKAMGTSTSAFTGADGNGNGLVDDADYAVWQTNFGNTLAASASSAAHFVESSEAPPSSGSVQVFATGQAKPDAGSWQDAKASGIGQPTTDSADLPSPLANPATSFDFARKTVRQPFRPATVFETQDRALLALIPLLGSSGSAPRSPFGLESDLAFTLHETDRYFTGSQELLLETVSDANREWPLESESTGLVPLNLVDKKLSIRDKLFSKWNEWRHLPL
jgi:Ca2+-binding RTX toxin-like protein